MQQDMHRDHALPADSSFTEGSGPRLGCFQPTHAVFHHGGTTYHWNSRYHRKGRYPAVHSTVHHQGSPPRMRLLPIWFGYPFADISYWVGLVFTLGCVAWVINGHYALFESGGAVARNAEQALTVSAAAALVGGTLFEIGSWLLYWEALNPEPHVVTGRELQQHKHHKHHNHNHKPSHTATDAAGNAAATGPGQQAAGRASTLHPAGAPSSSSSSRGEDAIVVNAASAASADGLSVSDDEAAPGMLLYAANERPRLAAHRQMQVLMQEQQRQRQQQQPRRRWKPAAAAAPAGAASTAANGAARSLQAGANKQQQQQQQIQLVPQQDIEAPADSTSPATAAVPVTPQGSGAAAGEVANAGQRQGWRWWGLRLHDIGFNASFLQLIGATIFWVPCMFGAPTAYPAADLTNDRTWDGVYWLFQVVGASFFIASSLLFMLEVQPAWWRPKPLLIGWHVGFWNLVGSVGFWLSGLFGFWAVPSGRYQLGGTILSTFWGSYAFLIGSYVQLLEAVNKHPQSLSCRRVAASK